MKLKNGMIVHCDTKEKAEQLLIECHKQGWKWCSGVGLVYNDVADTRYNAFGKNTVYYLNDEGLSYDCISSWLEKKVISFDDLFKAKQEKGKCKIYTKPNYMHDDVKKVIVNEPCVIVILKTGEKGVSKCHPEDIFDERLGYEIAYHRAKIQNMKSNLKFQETRLKYLIKYNR